MQGVKLTHLLRLAVVATIGFGSMHATHAQTNSCESPLGEAYLDANNVRARVLNNGNLFWRGAPRVYEVPKNSGIHSGFLVGLIIGGLVDGELRVAGARYGNYEYWAGPLDESTGMPVGECGEYDRLYQLTRSDIASFEAGAEPTADLRDWPTGLGAPTLGPDGSPVDIDDIPLSERRDRIVDLAGGERPNMVGDEMIWWVMNDVAGEHRETGTPPIGMEVRATAFSFVHPGPLDNMTFYRYQLVYRGHSTVSQVHVGFYNDVDVGSLFDDYVGSDTLLGLGYAYNADNIDEGADGYGVAPPAIGVDIVQGPVGLSGTRLEMSSFLKFYGGGSRAGDPGNGTDHYNYIRGLWKDGSPIRVGGGGYEQSGAPTRFSFPGDPVTRSYWSELNVDGARTANLRDDNHYVLGTGPFTMQPGDEQEIVIAIVWARGRDHLDSVTELRRADRVAQAVADAGFNLAPPTLDAPVVSAAPLNGAVSLMWSNTDSSSNADDAFLAYSPSVDATYAFEGYDVYEFGSASDSVGTRIATYDRINSVRRVIDSRASVRAAIDTTRFVAAEGRDTGLAHEHVVGGLDNHRTYHFGVQAYAYQGGFPPKVIRSKMARVSVEPRADYVAIDSTTDGMDVAAVLDAIGVVPNPYMAASAYEVNAGNGNGAGSAEVRFVNVPAGSSIRVFTLSGSLIKTLQQIGEPTDSGNATLSMVPPPSVRWDLTNESGRRISGGLYLVHVNVPGLGERVLKFSMVAGD